MEEKNNQNKITFGTYVVIVTIVFLVLLVGILAGILIQKNKEKKVTNINENVVSNLATENEADKENIVENNIDTTNKQEDDKEEEKPIDVKGEKLVQFDNSFFELEDIEKEYRECDKIKNYKDFNYDLDGDGVIDKITIRKKKDEQRI